MQKLSLLVIIISLISTNVNARSTCDIFNNSPTSQHGAYVLTIVDNILIKWPQNKKLKTMMTDPERIDAFKDSIKKISFYCKSNQDFKAGVSLGDDLFLYKKMLSELE